MTARPHRGAACLLPPTVFSFSEHSQNMPGSPAANAKHTGESCNNNNGAPAGGPLPCLTFEVLRCTTLEDMESLVARTLKVDSNEIRLWVITQPLNDAPLAPRQLLRYVARLLFLYLSSEGGLCIRKASPVCIVRKQTTVCALRGMESLS